MQAIDYHPSILLQTNTLLMSIRMSMTMSNTKEEAKPISDAYAPAAAANLATDAPKPLQLPAADLAEEAPVDDVDINGSANDILTHRKNQIKRLLTETWLRVALIIGALLTAVLLIVFVKSASDAPVAQDSGDRSTSMVVSTIPDGSDNLNPAQAEYLMKLHRQEAAEKAKSGVTNAPSLVLPKATVAGVDANATSDASAFTVGSTKSYYESNEPEAVETISLVSGNNDRFSTVGASKLDEQANQIAIERARKAAASVQAQPGTDPALLKANNAAPTPVATYNANQNNSGYNGGSNGGSNGGNNGGSAGNNGGGDTSAAAAGTEQAQQRQPDPDLPIVQQRLYDSYNQQVQELQDQEDRLQAQQNANQQQAEQLRQQRQQLAAQAIANQMQSQANQRSGNGFTSKQYSVTPKETEGEGSTQSPSYWERQPPSGFQPSAYSNNSAYGYQGQASNQRPVATPPPLLDKNIVRAGTRWPVVITKHVNTDEGLNVSGVIVGGPFDGAAVHGVVQPSGRNVGISFNRIEPKNPRKPIIPLNALAQTIGSQKEAVASQVKNHHFQNYSVMALESAIGGYGEAYSDQNQTVVTGPNGLVIESKGETTKKEVTAEILKEFSQKLNQDIGRLGNRAPTFIINQGTVLQMVLLSNLDIYGTMDGGSNSGQPQTQQQQSSNAGRSSL